MQHIYELTSKAVTKTHYLAHWKEDGSRQGNATSIKGDRGIQGKRGVTGGAIGPHGPKGVRADIGPSRGGRLKGDRGGSGSSGPKGERDVAGVQEGKGNVGLRGPKGVQGVQGAKVDRCERGECGAKGEKGIQGDNSNVLSVLAEHLPTQPATRYGEEMCFTKYHVSEDRSCIVELSRGVGTLRFVSAYHEPACHFDAKFVSGQGHEMSNVQISTGHGHFL